MRIHLKLLYVILLLSSMLTAYSKDVAVKSRPRIEPKDGKGTISLSSSNIYMFSAQNISKMATKLSFKCFYDPVLNLDAKTRFSTTYALATTGGTIQFKTNSPTIQLAFTQENGMKESRDFQLLRDCAETKMQTFDAAITKPITITLTDLLMSGDYVYEVVLPCNTNVSLTKLELEADLSLSTYTPTPKGIYLSFGDSITHGTGQGGDLT